MDTLDPISEIISTGQAFSPAIVLEKIIWIMIGFFFVGAISTSFLKFKLNFNSLKKYLLIDYFKTRKKNVKRSHPNLKDDD